MRAGLMDRTITIQRVAASSVDAAGTPVETWLDIATVRAQQVQQSTDEYIRGYGASDETVIVFRIWWFAGLTNADRVIFNNIIHEIKQIKEIGRRAGMELRTLSYGKAA
jgi:head-tail adaptor